MRLMQVYVWYGKVVRRGGGMQSVEMNRQEPVNQLHPTPS